MVQTERKLDSNQLPWEVFRREAIGVELDTDLFGLVRDGKLEGYHSYDQTRNIGVAFGCSGGVWSERGGMKAFRAGAINIVEELLSNGGDGRLGEAVRSHKLHVNETSLLVWKNAGGVWVAGWDARPVENPSQLSLNVLTYGYDRSRGPVEKIRFKIDFDPEGTTNGNHALEVLTAPNRTSCLRLFDVICLDNGRGLDIRAAETYIPDAWQRRAWRAAMDRRAQVREIIDSGRGGNYFLRPLRMMERLWFRKQRKISLSLEQRQSRQFGWETIWEAEVAGIPALDLLMKDSRPEKESS